MKTVEDKSKEIFLESLESFKSRGYMDIHQLVPRIVHTIVHHFLFRDTKYVPKDLKHMLAQDLMNNSDFLFAHEIYGKIEPNDDFGGYDDYIWEFKCKINSKWRYGIWLNIEAKDMNDTWITIFAMHEWRIDKFKPGYAKFCKKISLKQAVEEIILGGCDLSGLLYDLVQTMIFTRFKVLSYAVYGHQFYNRNLTKKYLEDWWYFDVERKTKTWILRKLAKIYSNHLFKKAEDDPDIILIHQHVNDSDYGPYVRLTYGMYYDLDESRLEKSYIKHKCCKWMEPYVDQVFRQYAGNGNLGPSYYFNND